MLRRCPLRFVPPTAAYQQFINRGVLEPDVHQAAAVAQIERVYNDLLAYQSQMSSYPPRDTALRPPNRLGVVPSFVLKQQEEKKLRRALSAVDPNVTDSANYHQLSNVKGLYLYGGVGCGKSMLMDILFNEAPMTKKQRIHFHQFMMDVHKTTHTIRQHQRTADAQVDLYDEVAQRLISNVELLCFDEMVVADVADAMILKRLFHAFYKMGVCAVFTSNRAPSELYKGGLNRESFLPFIRLLEDRCVVHHVESTTDYRLASHATSGSGKQVYFSPINEETEGKMQSLFLEMGKGMPCKERVLRVFGRDVVIPRAIGGICRFDFLELCASEMSAADYEVIAKTFHTMFLENVPQFNTRDSDVKRRFLTLIDVLYDRHVKVIFSAQAPPFELIAPAAPKDTAQLSGETPKVLGPGQRVDEKTFFEREIGQLVDANEGSFQMQRAISRIHEMSSTDYLMKEHKAEEVDLDTC